MILLFLNGCSSDNANNDLFQYKNSYVGDNSAVVNIVIHLQGADYFNGLELKTKEEPFGIVIKYDWLESEFNYQETVINNASYLFALIQNVEWVTFNFEMVDSMEEYKITRQNLQEWYGIKLSEIDNENELKELIRESLEDDMKVNELLN
nr:DUF4825 domain-containing protein [Bacillus sp. B15-48]